jgi:hypothetical protein
VRLVETDGLRWVSFVHLGSCSAWGVAQMWLASSLLVCRACTRTVLPPHYHHRRHRHLKVPRGRASRRWKGRNGWPTGPAVESEISTSSAGL